MIRWWRLGSALALVACKDGAQEHGKAAAPPAAAPAAAAQTTPLCQRTGHWSECTIRIRLEQSGLAPRVTEESIGELPRLDVAPVRYVIGNAGLAVYLYSDTTARRHAASTLDTVRFIPQSKAVGMRGEATQIQNDNALVILFSRNEHQRERVSDAITGGPPQP